VSSTATPNRPPDFFSSVANSTSTSFVPASLDHRLVALPATKIAPVNSVRHVTVVVIQFSRFGLPPRGENSSSNAGICSREISDFVAVVVRG
jgi:hypothetical protein